jgi:hypothetical protein
MMGDFLADRSTNGSRPSSTNGSRPSSTYGSRLSPTNGSRFGGTSAYVAPAEIFPPLSSGAAIYFYLCYVVNLTSFNVFFPILKSMNSGQ